MKKNALKDNSAFTIMEILVSIAILSGLMIAVAQTASWCFQERKRNHAQFLALQLLENLKEEVKAAGFEKINPSWGLQMKDLSRYKALPPECTIEVETGSVPENKFLIFGTHRCNSVALQPHPPVHAHPCCAVSPVFPMTCAVVPRAPLNRLPSLGKLS